MLPCILVAHPEFLKRHVQLKDFFEKLGWNVLGGLLADVKALGLQDIFGALDGVTEGAEGIVQKG